MKIIGRNHTTNQFYEAFEIAESIGFDCINTDLIAGLYTDTFDSFKNSLDKVIDLGPDNITVHSFCVKKSSSILQDNKDIYTINDEDAIKSVNYSYEALKLNSFQPYYLYRQKNTIGNLENVGYSKNNKFGLYNVFMMADSHSVFGIGSGATTKLIKEKDNKVEIKRFFSPKYPFEYLNNGSDNILKIKDFFGSEVL